MTMVQSVLHKAAVGVGVAQDPKNLNILTKPGCAAVIWQRQPKPTFQKWMNSLNPDMLPSARLVLKPQKVSAALSQLCDASSMPDLPHRQHLIEDITALSHLFCDLMDAPYVRLRLSRINANACRKFHIDAVTARLICTYRGTGTQYGISLDGAEPKRVFTVPTGAPMLLRGTLWPEEPRSGLLHRSPPIEGTGETRLVLVLDPIFDLEEET